MNHGSETRPSGTYAAILKAAVAVDERFSRITSEELAGFETAFTVPPEHPRSSEITQYRYVSAPVAAAFGSDATLVLADDFLRTSDWLAAEIPKGAVTHWLVPNETETKECNWLDGFSAREAEGKGFARIVAIGGGITINAASYLAERARCRLAYVPTTVLAMADAAIGGKVRANKRVGSECHKHAYRSWYEPDLVVLDRRFLDTVPAPHVSAGMGEIIKQGVYQSPPLLAYLASDAFDPFRDREALLKSILWAVALAANCLNVDPLESMDGSHIIMRGAHDAAERIEQSSDYRVPHGIAVAQAIRQELADAGSPLLPEVDACLVKFNIPLAAL